MFDGSKTNQFYSFDCEALLVAGNGLVGFTQYYKGKFDAYQRTYVLSDFRNVLPSFLRYYVSVGLPMEVQPKSIGSVIQFIKLGDLLNFNITLPSIEQQTIISNYLEFKIIQIDAILSKTRSSIEEYKKLKQAVITQAVTKGVRGEREMKDSGVEWIGKVPSKWNCIKINIFLKSEKESLEKKAIQFFPLHKLELSPRIFPAMKANLLIAIQIINFCTLASLP